MVEKCQNFNVPQRKIQKTVVMLHPAGVVCSWRKVVHNAEENLFIAIAQP
jgi:hypothetical protein